MRVDPARALHVGDSYRADVLGARRVGIEAVLIARESADLAHLKLREEHEDPHTAVISDLYELLDLLDIERPIPAPARSGQAN
jgi:FMN phosphatase YigB (HAD superfamily)